MLKIDRKSVCVVRVRERERRWRSVMVRAFEDSMALKVLRRERMRMVEKRRAADLQRRDKEEERKG
ncbi:hypothetical protein FRX31_019578 [Thalictrum thalictroides]|uniref:Uncharacterized protein n=1 Tax=Thalictrum thalictroides TaxID=46969 RepID=A0A7J6W0D7_THATH|nr:hypothetical protein FRX31_019578 [Thalictrum thalictroides]